MKLVICEKPSVGAAVAAALGVREKKDGYIEGNGYFISWCIGHLVGLAEAAVYGEQYRKWSYDSLPILPQEWQYTVAADKGKQFKILKDLMHRADVSEVVNACDAGREGELIFRFVYEMAGCKKPFTRLWISSMETGAIKCGFENLKDGRGYDALYHSALCRAKADWIIGINATRLFSCLYGKTLNVGRVQTPTLKMLVDRDAAITNFKKETYYHVRLMLPGAEAASAKICVADEASRLKAACEASAAVCTSLVKEKKTIAPPKLFDLTSLQREANRIYGYTAKQTLDLAQALYEKKLLTYPRTDSAFQTDDMGETATGIIKVLCEKLSFMEGADFSPEIAKVLNSKKVSDHHAIIPTMELAKTDLTTLPESERNILILTGARLLMATAEPHVYEAVTAVFSCADHEFTARGKTVIAAGWKNIERLYRATLKKKPDSDDEENELALDVPDFTEGQTLPADNYTLLYEHGERVQPAGQYLDGNPDPQLGKFERFEAQPNDPEALHFLMREEKRSYDRLKPGDFKAHITALHDSRIEAEAQRIVAEMKRQDSPNSPNKTHFMVELSPYFMQLASTKDTDRLFAMLPCKTLSFSKIEGRHGTFAFLDKSEDRSRNIRKARPSVRAQLTADKKTAAPKKAAAKRKNHDLEV